jgi:hypothetical protein
MHVNRMLTVNWVELILHDLLPACDAPSGKIILGLSLKTFEDAS